MLFHEMCFSSTMTTASSSSAPTGDTGSTSSAPTVVAVKSFSRHVKEAVEITLTEILVLRIQWRFLLQKWVKYHGGDITCIS